MASQTSAAWRALDEHFAIRAAVHSGGSLSLSADDIKRIGRREPRLMTKWDSREARPVQLRGITILPTANGEYLLVAGDGYHDIEPPRELRSWQVPARAHKLETLPWHEPPASESQAIDMAHASGLLADFLGEEAVYLTIRGRLRTGRFAFKFTTAAGGEREIVADGVQTEVDAGFEGEHGIYLVEAKLGARTNIHCRQLYYPYRLWLDRGRGKPVYAVFLSWANQRFGLRRYVFEPPGHYQAIRLLAGADYILGERPGRPTLAALAERTVPVPLPEGVPFPQADDLGKVIDIVDATASGVEEPDAIAARYGFAGRQARYYGNAAAFLGLLRRRRRRFELTEPGLQLVRSGHDGRMCLLTERILSLPVFRQAGLFVVQHEQLPADEQLVDWIRAYTDLSGTTLRRRANTVKSWLRWLCGGVQLALPAGTKATDAPEPGGAGIRAPSPKGERVVTNPTRTESSLLAAASEGREEPNR